MYVFVCCLRVCVFCRCMSVFACLHMIVVIILHAGLALDSAPLRSESRACYVVLLVAMLLRWFNVRFNVLLCSARFCRLAYSLLRAGVYT